MSSPEWRGIRDLVFRRDGYVCQACLEAPATQVHHTTYRYPLSQTPLWTLYSVCTPCHEQITRMERELRGETWLNGGDK
jgi:5-methylcytosine-specific restriction endonuclease McrA